MSFENDIGAIKQLVEDKPLFKPAGNAEISNREEAGKARRAATPIIPVDPFAMELTDEVWRLIDNLKERLYRLQEEKNGGNEVCECDEDKIMNAGEDWGADATDVPGEGMELIRRCLRCGGMRDNY